MSARAFNQPLMLEPAYARVFFSVLGERLGANRLIDVTGQSWAGDELKELASSWDENPTARNYKPYRVERGIAVLPITGTLVHKFGYVQPLSGMTGYDGIARRLQQAISDPDVRGVLLDIDSPGGEVAGAFDTADLIARLREVKPVWALASDMACSAGYLIAAACSRRLATQTARVGSIGVLVAHRSYEAQLAEDGVEVTLIYSGAHKVDGNPFQHLSEQVRADIQAKIDATRDLFAQSVATHTGLKKSAILATEAAVYDGAEALKVRLADEIVNYADAVNAMADALKPKGNFMDTSQTEPTQAPVATTSQTPETQPVLTQQDAASAELARVMAILECEEAKGREPLARALAKMPGMTLENARSALLVAPQAAQARTETALDSLMTIESPAAVAGGGNSGDKSSERVASLVSAGNQLAGDMYE